MVVQQGQGDVLPYLQVGDQARLCGDRMMFANLSSCSDPAMERQFIQQHYTAFRPCFTINTEHCLSPAPEVLQRAPVLLRLRSNG